MSRLGKLIRRTVAASAGGGTPVVPVSDGTRLSEYFGSMLNDPNAVIDIGSPPSGSPAWILDMDVDVDTLTFSGLMMDDRSMSSITLRATEGLYHGAGSQLLIGRPDDLATGRTIISREYMFNGLSTLWGKHAQNHRTRLAVTLAQGATTALVRDYVGDWKAGDRIVIWHTDWYGERTPFEFTLTADCGAGSIPLPTPAPYKFWGQYMYLQNAVYGATGANAVTLTQPSSVTVPNGYQGRTRIDQSACIVNLTRGIQVNGPNDGGDFGHTMAMTTGRYQWTGYRQTFMGRPSLGHYPTHEHLLSQDPTNTVDTGAVTNSWRKFGVVEGSLNKAFVWHGTRGSVIHDCIAYKVQRMNFFGEDGNTADYDLQRNVSFGALNAPNDANLFRKFDATVAGFWLSHPQGVFKDNWAVGSQNIGEWDSFSDQCFGFSVSMPRVGPQYYGYDDGSQNTLDASATTIKPARLGNVEGTRSGNFYFGCNAEGLNRASAQIAEDGTVAGSYSYKPSRNQVNPTFFDFRGAEIAKCLNGYTNRIFGTPRDFFDNVGGADYQDLVVSDCRNFGLVGSASGIAKDLLIVGKTANYTTPQSADNGKDWPAPMSSYEGSLLPSRSIFANFDGTSKAGTDPQFNFFPHGNPYLNAGIQLYDVYLHPVMDWPTRAVDMVFHNSLFGFRVPSGLMCREMPDEYGYINQNGTTYVNHPENNDNQSFWQGVLVDNLHYMGPYESWTFKRAMYTHGSTFVDCPGSHNGVKVDRSFMGMSPRSTETSGSSTFVIESFQMIRHPDADLTDTAVDTMTRPLLPNDNDSFSRLAHLPLANGGRYTFRLPAKRPSTNLTMTLYRFTDASKATHLQFEWDGTKTVNTPVLERPGSTWSLKTSKAAVNASTTNAWWQDKTNNILHLKVFGSPVTAYDITQHPNNQNFASPMALTLTAS